MPTFAIHARDDWVCMEEFCPLDKFSARGSNLLVAMTDTGTHAVHLTGLVFPQQFYPAPMVDFIEFLEHK